MKKFILSAVALCMLAVAPFESDAAKKKRKWSRKAKATVIGAGTGAVVGGAVKGRKGAAVGAAAGAGTGYMMGRHRDKTKGKK